MIGGQAPHISKREGNVEPPKADVRALPTDYARNLIATTIAIGPKFTWDSIRRPS